MDTQSYNSWGALIVVPVVVALNAVLLMAAARRERDPWFTRVLVLGFAAKMVGVFGRYFVAYYIYRGTADAEGYNQYAVTHYLYWRAGNITWDPSSKPGTQAMELLTTALYTVVGPTVLSAFFVFGSLAFWGVYLLYRAFRIALPGADHRRYALLLFLLPSLLYWPSSIGKESWILLFIGVTALGAARFFNRQIVSGAPLLVVGALGTALIRPHVTVLLFAALFVAQIVRPTTKTSTSILTKAAGLFVLGIAGVILATQSAQFLGIDDFSWQAVADQVEWAGGQTAQGGSVFTPVPLNTPLGIPAAVVTLLFRPFPWEASNVQMLLQSLEGLLLIWLTITAWPRLKALPRLLRRNPYLVFALVYTLAFIIAFAGFANFGILARQRVLMLPFFLVLLSLPLPVRHHKRRSTARRDPVGVR